MALFKVSTASDKENAMTIQGTCSHDTNKDIAGIILQNYDNDDHYYHNMAMLSMRDHYGDTTHNGYGDLLFKTNPGNGDPNQLVEQMRITYAGNVGIQTADPVNTLDVVGTIGSSILNPGTVLVCTGGNTITSSVISVDELNTLSGMTNNVNSMFSSLLSNLGSYSSSNSGGGGFTHYTADRVIVSDGNGFSSASSVLSSELVCLSGATQNIQSQIDTLQPAITGSASSITSFQLPANVAVTTDGTGLITSSSTTSTQIGYLANTTSDIQTQLNAKQDTVTGAATTTLTNNLTPYTVLVSDGFGKIAASSLNAAQLSYLSTINSNVQSQLNAQNLWQPSTSNIYYNGNVGIGMIPSTALQVSGVAQASSFQTSVQGTAANPVYTFNGNSNMGMYAAGADTLAFGVKGAERMRLSSNGYMGIGVIPAGPLEVMTGLSASTGSVRYFNATSGSALLSSTAYSANVSIIGDSSIWVKNGYSFIASSDRRIKKDIELASASNISAIFDSIELYKYRYIDETDVPPSQSNIVHGFVAQEVKQHFPEACDIQTDFIPNIFAPSTSIGLLSSGGQLRLSLSMGSSNVPAISIGDTVQFYRISRSDPYICAIDGMSISEDGQQLTGLTLTLPSDLSQNEIQGMIANNESVFVYGTQVTDFITIDKHKLMVVCYGTVKDLKSKLVGLESDYNNLRADFQSMQAQLSNLQARMSP